MCSISGRDRSLSTKNNFPGHCEQSHWPARRAKQPTFSSGPASREKSSRLNFRSLRVPYSHPLRRCAAASHFATGDSLAGDIEGATEDSEEIASDITAGEDETITCALSGVQRQADLLSKVLQDLEKEPFGEVVFLQCDIKVDFLGVVAKLHAVRWIAKTPAGSVPDRADLDPEIGALRDSVEVVDDLSLVTAANVVEVIE